MAPSLSRGSSIVYILRLQSGTLYVGCSDDCETRFRAHEEGTASRTTAQDRPLSVVFVEVHLDFVAARRREAQIKRWSRAKKEALVLSDSVALRRLSKKRY